VANGSHERHDRLWRMLQIVVHDHDDVALRLIESGHRRVVLAKIPGKADPLDEGMPRSERLDDLPASIRASVVDEDEFEAISQPGRVHRRGYLVRQMRQNVLAAVYRNDDGNFRSQLSQCHRNTS